MITYVCCRGSGPRYERYLAPSLRRQQSRYGVEVLELAHPRSIFAAYEEGRRSARHDIVAYVHDDVDLLDPHASARIAEVFESRPRAGLVGLCGSVRSDLLPWWHNRGGRVGHWIEQNREGHLLYYWSSGRRFARDRIPGEETFSAWEARKDGSRFRGVAAAGLLDGFLLAEHRARLDLPWDTHTCDGWHAYDADRCLQAHAAGVDVLAIDVLACHYDRPHDPEWHRQAARNFDLVRRKWRLRRSWRRRVLGHPWA